MGCGLSKQQTKTVSPLNDEKTPLTPVEQSIPLKPEPRDLLHVRQIYLDRNGRRLFNWLDRESN